MELHNQKLMEDNLKRQEALAKVKAGYWTLVDKWNEINFSRIDDVINISDSLNTMKLDYKIGLRKLKEKNNLMLEVFPELKDEMINEFNVKQEHKKKQWLNSFVKVAGTYDGTTVEDVIKFIKNTRWDVKLATANIIKYCAEHGLKDEHKFWLEMQDLEQESLENELK